jgi:hypothetical protein
MIGKVGSLVALLGGGKLFLHEFVPTNVQVVYVNDDDVLLSEWDSESLESDVGAQPECSFWEFETQFSRTLCSHFTISRATTAPVRAAQRALRCAGAAETECILSPEVGLALPAAFLVNGSTGNVRSLVAPRLLPLADSEAAPAALQRVRASVPGADALFGTRTFQFEKTVLVEFLDGASRRMQTMQLSGQEAYCVQLLREAYEPACWANLE